MVASIEDDPFHRFGPEAAALVPDGEYQILDFHNDAIAKGVDAFLKGA